MAGRFAASVLPALSPAAERPATTPMTDPELLAYHEAGHVVVAAECGGRVLSASVDVEWDGEGLPREGEIVVDWPRGRSPKADVWVALAGPVAETVYRGHDEPDGSELAGWQEDWRAAAAAVSRLFKTRGERTRYLNAAASDLHAFLSRADVWAVVGDVADALSAHEQLDEEMLADVLGAWGM